jgi:hypothetical protein
MFLPQVSLHLGRGEPFPPDLKLHISVNAAASRSGRTYVVLSLLVSELGYHAFRTTDARLLAESVTNPRKQMRGKPCVYTAIYIASLIKVNVEVAEIHVEVDGTLAMWKAH